MRKSERKTAAILASAIAVNIACGMAPVRALNPDDVLNDNLDELQQHIVNYIFIKNYVSGNISLSNEFKVKLDYNSDGLINILDASRAKNKILELSDKHNTPTTSVTTTTTPTTTTSVTTTTTTTPVTTSATTTAPVTTSATTTTPVTTSATTTTPVATTTSAVKYDNLKIGDKVQYNGSAHYMADGTGRTVDVSGTFIVKNILPGDKYLYSVQLENTGWVSYEKLTGKKPPSSEVTTAATTTKATAATTAGIFKKGDKVRYSGKAYYTANGGTSVDVSGTFKIVDILTDDKYKYKLQLENAGWVPYESVKAESVTTTTKVTTAATTTKESVVTTAGTIKKGDKIQYSGKAYYTANGGTSVDVSGTFKVVDIVTGSNYKYKVQLENAGWVPYESVKQVTTTTTTTTTTTASVTTPSSPVTKPSTIKEGDKIQYSGKAYYTSNGGTSVDISGTFTIKKIITETNDKYTVQLDKVGWVSYEAITGKKQDTVSAQTLDGNTYKIKNALSGKYITVGGTTDRSNVYQSSSNDSKEQKFTFKSYYNALNCYRMYACCNTDHRVIDIVKDSNQKVSDGCNVQIYEDVDPDAQTWDIISVGNNKYKIVSHKNSSVAMTASGNSDGSATGKTPSSAGNVYISTYTGTDSQLWCLEKTN